MFLACGFFPMNSLAYKWVIYTDQQSGDYAENFVDKVKNMPPFDKFDIEIVVKVIDPSMLDCSAYDLASRLIKCKTEKIRKDLLESDGDQAMIIKDHDVYQGSGGSIPMVTTATPYKTLVHELCHTFGLADEYEYSEEEARTYCKKSIIGSNVARIKPKESDYKSDTEARKKHRKKIPWYGLIKESTKITHNGEKSLGTAAKIANLEVSSARQVAGPSAQKVGLYPAKTCNNYPPKKYKWWQASGEMTMMSTLGGPFDLGRANETILFNILRSRGVPLKSVEGTVHSAENLESEPRSPKKEDMDNGRADLSPAGGIEK